ncbi:hypothetical protein LZC95_46040 [Pendulispora brunnea]|uniref:VWFA domain-containing protein n=1 Tax=Pendulispora brunnea TaxID=2905690 RepID=A0ABZ2KAB7_9BACT
MNLCKIVGGAAAGTLVVALSAACGSESGDSGRSALDPGAQNGLDAGGDAEDHDARSAPVDAGGDASVCGTAESRQTKRRINAVVMHDRSGSLVRDAQGVDTKATRWDPIVVAMKSFFADPQSAGLSASLHYFPIVESGDPVCISPRYATPAIGLTALPNTALGTSVEGQSPAGGSPMRSALEGAVSAAKDLAAKLPGAKPVVVLVTDGGPNACESTNANVQQVIASAYQGAPSIPTVVVAVGPELPSLNQFASAGGTERAIVVSPSDPAKASRELVTKLNQLRPSTAPCSMTIPALPSGRTLAGATVTFTSGSGASTTVPYAPACSGGNGWHYNDADAPTSVVLCPNTCNVLQQNPEARISVTFNCAP